VREIVRRKFIVMKFFLAEMTSDEAKEVAPACVLLAPVATVEQHGPHLPLHTDIDNIAQILAEVARRTNPPARSQAGEQPRVLVAPPVWFSFSPFDPQVYPGSIRTRPDVFASALNDILESYLRGGFRKIVVVNGHGGGTELVIPEVVRRLNSKVASIWRDWQIPAEAKVVQFCWWVFLAEFAREELERIRGKEVSLDWHGGDIETSLQLYLRPDLVDMSKAKRGSTFSREVKFSYHDLADWHRQYVVEGYPAEVLPGDLDMIGGDPTTASREKGEAIFNLAVEKVSEFIREFASR
jgi:creatinine amidohydrolase